MAMRQFKAESKKLLDLMINSIYTNREIFLRELISNASDACDKLYFKSLTDTSINVKKEDLHIHIAADKENRTLTISDNGIGMTKDELEKNLGTIARSGSQQGDRCFPRGGQRGSLAVVVLRRGGIHPDRSRKAGSWHRDHPGAERGHRNRQIQRISGRVHHLRPGQEVQRLHPLPPYHVPREAEAGGRR